MTGHTPLVVDDHVVLRAAASTMFAAERSDVVDEAADGAGLSGRIILGRNAAGVWVACAGPPLTGTACGRKRRAPAPAAAQSLIVFS
jgi:hypothetical protein